MDNGSKWAHVAQLALFAAVGLGCIYFGQVSIGQWILAGTLGNALPPRVVPMPGSGGGGLPPFLTGPTPNGFVRMSVVATLAIVLASLLGLSMAHAQGTVTVTSQQNSLLTNPATAVATGGLKINPAAVNCASAAGSRWTGWVYVGNQRNVVWDLDFVDANASAASLDVRCETSRSSATVADAGRDLPAIVSTASTGTSSVVPAHTWSYVATGGGAPGSFATTLYIENIPAPFIECLLTCGAGGAAADTLSAFARGVNP